MFEYTSAAIPYLNTFEDGKVYTVPYETTQYIALVEFTGLFDVCTVPSVVSNALRAVMPIPDSCGNLPLMPSNDSGLGMPLHNTPRSAVSERTPLTRETYSWCDGTRRAWCRERFSRQDLELDTPALLSCRHFLVLEWEAILYRNDRHTVVLSNTMDALQGMCARSSAARHAQWGFMLCRACDPDVPAPARSVRVKIQRWEMGVPYLSISIDGWSRRGDPRQRVSSVSMGEM